MDTGMQGTVTFAVQSILIRPLIFLRHFYRWGLFKFRIYLEQVAHFTCPGLMTRKIDPGFFHVLLRKRNRILQFRVRSVLIPVINAQNEHIDPSGSRLFINKRNKLIHTLWFWICDTEAPDR